MTVAPRMPVATNSNEGVVKMRTRGMKPLITFTLQPQSHEITGLLIPAEVDLSEVNA